LSKLKKQPKAKVGRHAFSLAKHGDAQVCILGMTQTGKSTLLSMLTNAKPKISDVPYTTKKPEIGVMEWEGTKIQIVELPSTFQNIHMNVAQTCDGIIVVYRNEKDLNKIREVLVEFKIDVPFFEINISSHEEIDEGGHIKKISSFGETSEDGYIKNLCVPDKINESVHIKKISASGEEHESSHIKNISASGEENMRDEEHPALILLKEKIWRMLSLVRVYTKEPGKKAEKRALVLNEGDIILDAAKQVHKDFIRFFSFARVWGDSAKYPGQMFGLGHVLKDGDIVEFHMKKK
ncbi:MAG: TGS domain-containing protein, partial [Candidatus Aenigmarchaeota archaeon]|nr:TGS domain-containing protein [Candidatus Aenigmarchaeota archaeon]